MIIVTGGAGFIGSNLVAGLQAKGHTDIVVCDWLGADDKWRNLGKRELRDVIAPEALFAFLERYGADVQAVFHMGAISSTTETDVDLIARTNIDLSRRLWRWCADNFVRFIYASSAATYGDGAAGFTDVETPEGLSKFQPLNAYGWSKHMFDRRVARIVSGRAGDIGEKAPPQWAGLKFFNVYGPNEYHKGEQMSVMCKLYPQVMAGHGARLFKSHRPDYGDGGQMRDFVYVQDCVDVMLWLYENQKICGLFNVGTGKARSFKDLAEAVFAAAGRPAKINYVEMPENLREKYQYFTQADMSKLRAAGYNKPFTGLEEGVRMYVQDFMAAEDRYR